MAHGLRNAPETLPAFGRGAPDIGTEDHRLTTVEPVISAMRRHEPLSLNDMAEIAHLSPHHFARTFRRVTGIPPGEFMTALRLERAKRLLLTTDLGVGEICFEVGYNSVGSFTSRFTQLVGLTPSRMRLLPEKLETVHGRASEFGLIETDSESGPAVGGAVIRGVAGRIEVPDPRRALIFAGLFPGAIPQRSPAAGVMLTAPSNFVVPEVPDGIYHLMAAAVPLSTFPQSLLLPDPTLLVGRAEDLVVVRNGVATGRALVALRPMQTTDPPILTPLAMLLVQQVNPTDPDQPKRAR